MMEAHLLRTRRGNARPHAAAHQPAARGNRPASGRSSGQSLLLPRNLQPSGGPPKLLAALTGAERETVIKSGRRRVLYRGQTVFSQGARHDGIFLIETGRIRVFY